MIYINQVILDGFGKESNKKFLGLLFENNELVGSNSWFNPRGTLIVPEIDLTEFLSKFDRSYVRLQIGSPDPKKIIYAAMEKNNRCKTERREAWLTCPYNKNNFEVVSRLFEEAFEVEMTKKFPTDKGLVDYYRRMYGEVPKVLTD
ncbi:hypothetical protein J4474_01280 [Candidatus Pacearchaeota archaeon]|nr:hypothetical protein [Candidatus Pacearchaeota archaeon]